MNLIFNLHEQSWVCLLFASVIFSIIMLISETGVTHTIGIFTPSFISTGSAGRQIEHKIIYCIDSDRHRLLYIYEMIMSIINASSVNEPKASLGRELNEAGWLGKYLTAVVDRVCWALLFHSSCVCDLDLSLRSQESDMLWLWSEWAFAVLVLFVLFFISSFLSFYIHANISSLFRLLGELQSRNPPGHSLHWW